MQRWTKQNKTSRKGLFSAQFATPELEKGELFENNAENSFEVRQTFKEKNKKGYDHAKRRDFRV
ncbi:MAG: hypothetical protein KF881_04600 [Acidobacteria bacterium]|nr:hypothetical protein [Acidobacteriota bacterium]